MKILVTGGAGFIGSHLVDVLVRSKHRVIVVDNLSTGHKKFVHPRAKFYQTDIVSPRLEQIFSQEKPEAVFHLAAQKSVTFSVADPLADLKINVLGSLRIIENSLRQKTKKLIFMSTGGAIYGEAKFLPWKENAPEKPISPYGLSKLTVDNYLLNYYAKIRKLNFISLRPANVYGPRQDPDGEGGVIAIFVNNLLKGRQCYINGRGQYTRDYVYISDVIKACLKAMGARQGIYNLGTGEETSVNELYRLIAKLITPAKAKFRAARPGEVLRSALDATKARRELHWRPEINLEQGIKKTIEYFKSL